MKTIVLHALLSTLPFVLTAWALRFTVFRKWFEQARALYEAERATHRRIAAHMSECNRLMKNISQRFGH